MADFKPDVEHEFVDGCENKCGDCKLCLFEYCSKCCQYEGGLTTHCPCSAELANLHDAYEGEWDFWFGNWVKGIKNRLLLFSAQGLYDNELKMLKLLEENPVANKDYIEETREVLNSIHFCVSHVGVNGGEYLLDDVGNIMYFPTPQTAKNFIIKKGLTEEEFTYHAQHVVASRDRLKQNLEILENSIDTL